ncbi:MAG: hypothetical protein BGN99_33220 [Alphaproteobacteria bacterium 65-37]|jgi:hypothetical protein|nr:hypothetical protein [Alphaproteobacteria bacterium]OJU31511.1 MAG: hypothetical protein BGN99_33220 [Alphaproteobacteria bacterium 65-37]
MAGTYRNLSLSGAFLLAVGLVAVALNSAIWACLVAAVLAIAGVVLLQGNRWRTAALVVAALAISLAVLDAFAGFLSPTPMGRGLVRTTDPKWWPPPDPILGFRPQPDTRVIATATFGGEPVYRTTYHFDATAARVTPSAEAGADTYLFLGDSFTFGQGLADTEALAAQFTKLNGLKVQGVNLGVPGYAPNHLIRAFEAGLLDRYKDRNVKAVVTWIIPAQLARTTGDGGWLGSSPRYVLENGALRWTGTFTEYRWRNPIAGAKYLLGEQFAFIQAIGMRQRQEEQSELFVAMMAKLQALAREKFNAPLLIIYSWPDEQSQPEEGDSRVAHSLLLSTLQQVRKLGTPMVRVDALTTGMESAKIMIPHDGHPNAFTNGMVAGAVSRKLNLR